MRRLEGRGYHPHLLGVLLVSIGDLRYRPEHRVRVRVSWSWISVPPVRVASDIVGQASTIEDTSDRKVIPSLRADIPLQDADS